MVASDARVCYACAVSAAAFDEGDKDKSGTLDFDELKALLLKVGIEKDDLEVEEMLSAADKGPPRHFEGDAAGTRSGGASASRESQADT